MRKFGLILCLLGLLFTAVAHTAQLAIIVLNLQNWHNGTRPDGWELKVNHGQADVSECVEGNDPCLHLKSERSSFGLERSVDIDPNQTGDLAWTWKVAQLPNGGDFRRTATDDQAAQVLVAFADHRVLAYIWDSTAPKGIIQSASSLPLIHIYAVVCESGAADANRWISESRDVAADYQRAFGKPAPHVKGLRIQINSQHTGTVAESYFREVVFRSKPQ